MVVAAERLPTNRPKSWPDLRRRFPGPCLTQLRRYRYIVELHGAGLTPWAQYEAVLDHRRRRNVAATVADNFRGIKLRRRVSFRILNTSSVRRR